MRRDIYRNGESTPGRRDHQDKGEKVGKVTEAARRVWLRQNRGGRQEEGVTGAGREGHGCDLKFDTSVCDIIVG